MNRLSELLLKTLIGTAFLGVSPLRADEPAVDGVLPPAEETTPGAWSVSGKQVVYRGATAGEVELPGNVLAIAVTGDLVFAALGERGAARIRLNDGVPVVEQIISVPQGDVTGFTILNGVVWMNVSMASMVRLQSFDAPVGEVGVATEYYDRTMIPPVPLEPPGSAAARQPSGGLASFSQNVVISDVRKGDVRLSAGANAGIRSGQHLRVYRTVDAGRSGSSFVAEVQVGTLVVTAVNEYSAMAQVWRGDKVVAGDEVRPAPNEKASLAFPRQFGSILDLEVNLRPIIGVGGDGGFAMLNNAHLFWTGRYYYAGLRVQPLLYGWQDGEGAFLSTMLAEGGFNHRAFGVGIGFGVTTSNSNLNAMLSYDEGSTEANAAFSMSQTVRLGATDGLRFEVTNLLVYGEDDYDSGLYWAAVNGKFTFPVGRRIDMFFEGGGGLSGYGFGALGLFAWIIGNGDAGSFGLSASVGAAGIFQEQTYYNPTYGYYDTYYWDVAGPMFSLGARFRFGSNTFSL